MGGGKVLEEGHTVTLDWSKLDKVASKQCNVVPVIVQDTKSGAVLIAAYANEKALQETLKQRVCVLWSTSRNELWVKGATSGDTLDLDDVLINCEQNSLLYKVTPRRTGACHTKDASGESRFSCYYRRVIAKSRENSKDLSLSLSHMISPARPRDKACVLIKPAPAKAASNVSVFLAAFLPWGILAPLNILKLQLNKVSPGAHLWVPSETEQCQAACGIARMWATLFWSMQFANAVASLYLHYHRERGLTLLGAAHKLIVGTTLLKAYLGGVIYWPIGLAGPAIEWMFALLFLNEVRGM